MSEFRLSKAGIQNLRDIPQSGTVAGELTPFVSVSGAVAAIDTSNERKQSKVKFCLGLGAVLLCFLGVPALAQIILALIVLF